MLMSMRCQFEFLKKERLYVKFMKEGQNRGFHPSLRKLSIKSSRARRVLESVLKLGWNF